MNPAFTLISKYTSAYFSNEFGEMVGYNSNRIGLGIIDVSTVFAVISYFAIYS